MTGLLLFSGSVLAETTPQTIALRLWHPWKMERREILESILEDFNRQRESMEVIAEPLGPAAGSVADRMMLGPAAVRLPDLALVERDTIPQLVDAGMIRPLDEILRSSAFLHKKNLLDAGLAYGTYDGKLYGIPVRLNPYVLIYNSDLLPATGVTAPPQDWKTFIDLARTLDEDSSADADTRTWALGVRSMAPLFHILCIQKGIDLFGADRGGNRAPDIREILEFIHGLRRPRPFLPPQYKFWDPNFLGVASGKVLFQIDNASMLALLASGVSTPLAAAMVPSDSSPPRTYLSHSRVFVAPSSSGNTRGASEFLEFFYSPERYSRFVETFLFVSPLKDSSSILKEAASNRELYSQLVLAAENAGVHALTSKSGTMLPQIARIAEQVDAGLVLPGQATEEILRNIQRADQSLSASSRAGIRVTWAESTRRLYPSDVSRFRPAPIQIISARNEHETFQLAISTEQEMEGLTVSTAPFVSVNGKPQEIEMTPYLEDDTIISRPLAAREAGPYPNVLKRHDEFSISPGALTRLWIDIFVADDVPAGEYSSQVVIEHRDSKVVFVPIRLRVLPLRIPAAPSQPASVGLNYDLVAKHYGVQRESAAYRKLMNSFYWFLVEHRVSPYRPPVLPDSTEIAPYLLDKRVAACRVSFHPLDPRFRDAVVLAKEHGWSEKLFSYFIDEPTYHQYEAIIEAGKHIHSLSDPPKFLVTCFPEDFLVGAVDVWCIRMRFLPEGIPHGVMDRESYVDAVNRRLEAGDEVWWYTAGGISPFPTLHIEDDPSAFRIIPWLQQLYHIDGLLHWEAANWSQPFEEPFIQGFGNGEGVLVYPGDFRPAPSIRLELLREGLEDMEYLMLLRRNLEDAQNQLRAERLGDIASVRAGEICRRLILAEALRAHAVNGSFMLPHFVREPGNIERVREEVAEEILAIQKRPLALVLTHPEEKQYTDSVSVRVRGVVEPGCRAEVNGRKLAVDKTGFFSARLPLSQGTNTFLFQFKKGRYSKTVLRKIERF